MKAVVHDRFGDPDVLQFTDVPEPKTHVDSVLIRVRAAGINPADLALRAGALNEAVETYFPVVPGWDVAGVVERSGPGAPEFSPGDEVLGYIRSDVMHRSGAYAERVATDVRNLVRKPATLSWAEAGALPLAGLTAYQAVRALNLSEGEVLVVHGASGGVGSLAAQLAVSRGVKVIGTASEANQDYVRSFGAEPATYGATPHADAVLDTVGQNVPAGDRIVSIAGHPEATQVFARMVSADLQAVADLAAAGVLRVRVAATLPLARAAEAHRLQERGRPGGKIVLIPD